MFNILVDIDEGKLIFPAFLVLMIQKSFYFYLIIFEYLNNLLKQMGIIFKFEKAHIMTDFEHPLIKGILKLNPKSKLAGCFLHYSKVL